jgi:hypothetical protein
LTALLIKEKAILSVHDTVTDLEIIIAPWNKTVTLQNVSYEGGMNMLRFRIKEGKRFTDLELDIQSLGQLHAALSDWLAANSRNS